MSDSNLDSIKEAESRLSLIKKLLIKHVAEFYAGKLKDHIQEWIKLTSDSEILDMIRGLHIEFDSLDHRNPFASNSYNLCKQDELIIDNEVSKLLSKGVISVCEPDIEQHVSPVFTCPKKDGTFRMILNLKKLNVDITYKHFKMESLQAALQLVTPNCFMTSVDLKDAYYSVPIAEEDKKYLRFWWKDTLYEYNALPNGLALAPRKFTKLLKPVFAKLRALGYLSTSFIDDSLQLSDSKKEALDNVLATVELMIALGFVVHPEKSVFNPTQRITYLGMIIDSTDMSVTLTHEKIQSILQACKHLLEAKFITIRDLAKAIGKMIASFPAVKYGPLHFRHLEENKKTALKCNKGNFDSVVTISLPARREVLWWINNIEVAKNDIHVSEPDIQVESDASGSGWGCVCGEERTGGAWLPGESLFHINYLELKAAFLALKSFAAQLCDKHVRLLLDNSTAVACINKMGTSHSVTCNHITYLIWMWCIENNIWISAAHIPGKDNVAADQESRKQNLDAEWKLNVDFLNSALQFLHFVPDIDLFASRINFQFKKYISFKADPEAYAVDAFTFSWSNLNFYAFPPFSVILKTLTKVKRDRAEGVVVVPDWPTQVWYPLLNKLMVGHPFHFPQTVQLLGLPVHPRKIHHLLPKLKLLACRVSGRIL